MQFLLTEQEYKSLTQQEDSRFNQLTMIIHNIEYDLKLNELEQYRLIRQLSSDLAHASQDGTVDAVLNAWEHRK